MSEALLFPFDKKSQVVEEKFRQSVNVVPSRQDMVKSCPVTQIQHFLSGGLGGRFSSGLADQPEAGPLVPRAEWPSHAPTVLWRSTPSLSCAL